MAKSIFPDLNGSGQGFQMATENVDIYSAALAASIEAFETVRHARDPHLSEDQKLAALRVSMMLVPGLSAENYGAIISQQWADDKERDEMISMCQEAIDDKLAEIWNSAKVWAGKIWDGITSAAKSAKEFIDDAIDKLDRRLSGEYVEVNWPVEEVVGLIKEIPGQLKDLAVKAAAAIKSLYDKGAKAVQDAGGPMAIYQKLKGSVMEKIEKIKKSGGAAKKALVQGIKKNMKAVSDVFKLAGEGVGLEVFLFKENAKDAATDVANKAKEMYMKLSKEVTDLWTSFINKSKSIMGSITG